jgi:hypothetical protein
MKLKLPTLFRNRANLFIAGSLALVVIASGIIILQINAAGFFASSEPEAGTLSGNAQAVTDSTAAGGKAVKFTEPATPPPPTGSTSCPLPKYPTPSCAGVPAGTKVVNTITGNYTVTTPGQVIDAWEIKGDLYIYADNVVVKNSLITGTVDNEKSLGNGNYARYSFTISDSTVGPSSGCIAGPGVGQAKYTASRIYVHNHEDAFRSTDGGNVTVQDSFFTSCYLSPQQQPPDGTHSDGIQAVCGDPCPGFQILHNTFDLSGVPATFPLNLTEDALTNVVAKDNLLVGGGNYLIVAWWRSGANWIFHDNRLVKGTWGSDTRLIAAVSAEGTCSHQDWQGNSVVTIDSGYNITSTVMAVPCQE